MEPFLVPVTDDQRRWHEEDLNGKIDVVRRFAGAYGATLIRLNDIFADHAGSAGAASVIDDGVHPNADGHELIARVWWATVRYNLAAVGEGSALSPRLRRVRTEVGLERFRRHIGEEARHEVGLCRLVLGSRRPEYAGAHDGRSHLVERQW
jgi:hypothetical protein